jgi:hypothetical protein
MSEGPGVIRGLRSVNGAEHCADLRPPHWGFGGNCAIVIANSYFGFRFKLARWECENSWALGQTSDRPGTELVLAVRK